MSDYWPDIDTAVAELPLFSRAAATKKVRTYHERDQAQANV
jgi:hypothetical protein